MLMVKLTKFSFESDKAMMFLTYNNVTTMKKWLLIS
ncbi:not available [Bacillus cereus]|nr:not available [Bacillus cereus]